jgi:hypothetical protein
MPGTQDGFLPAVEMTMIPTFASLRPFDLAQGMLCGRDLRLLGWCKK